MLRMLRNFDFNWEKYNFQMDGFWNKIVKHHFSTRKILPRITHAIEKALNPWIEGMVSLPTFLSQMALKLVMMENDNRNSSAKPVKWGKLLYEKKL